VNFIPLKDAGRFQAKAFLLIDPKLFGQQEDDGDTAAVAEIQPTVTCRAGEQALNVRVVAMRPGFYRLELELPGLLFDGDSECELKWIVKFNDENYQLRSWGRIVK
jgi:hypothetical protein